MAAYSLAAECIIFHFSVADLPHTVPVAYWYAASLEQSFILPQICRRLFLRHTDMQQVLSKVSSCRRSAADCSCGILVCGKSGAKFHPAADLPQTVPVAYWYAASLQYNFFLPHTSAYSLPKICGRSAAGLRHTFHFPSGNDDEDIPYFFVSNEAFALRTWLMKPYARTAMARQERIYNYTGSPVQGEW